MRFLVTTDAPILLAFEPTAEEYHLAAGEKVAIEWVGTGPDGMVAFESGQIVVQAPTGGHTLAWRDGGAEIYVGPESGPDAS